MIHTTCHVTKYRTIVQSIIRTTKITYTNSIHVINAAAIKTQSDLI